MFRTAPVIEPAPVVTSEQLIPLVELELSLDTPAQGWAAHLATRNIEIVEDDLGRPAIARSDGRQLFAERAQHEAKRVEMLRLADAAAEELDRQFRASVGRGVPTNMIPADSTYAQAALAAELNSLDYRPRRETLVEAALSNSKEMIIHPLEREVVEW